MLLDWCAPRLTAQLTLLVFPFRYYSATLSLPFYSLWSPLQETNAVAR